MVKDGQALISSRLIANETGKEHKHVLEQIERLFNSAEISAQLAENEFNVIESEYITENNRTSKEYLLNKKAFTYYAFNIQGFEEFKIKYINKFEEMESSLKPQLTMLALAEAYVQSEKDRLALTGQVEEMTPKANYFDLIMATKETVTVTIMAKAYGKSAMWMNEKLRSLGIQFKQGSVWLLCQKYANEGYVETLTRGYMGPDGEMHSDSHTRWTQKGRLFVYNLLKAEGIVPIMEREQGLAG
jgi:Rha family phage regulatory protein